MASGEFQNLGYAVKTIYPSKALEAFINEEAPFRERLNRDIPAGGKVNEGTVKFNGVLALPQNVAQILDGDDLQDAADRTEVQFTLNPTIFQATMQVGWLTKGAVNSSKSGFNGGEVRRRTEETTGNLGKFIESTYVGTIGGIRGYVSSAPSGIVLADPEGVKLIRKGMKIAVGTAVGTARSNLNGVRVASVTPSTNTITTAGTDTDAQLNDVVWVVNKATMTTTNAFANSLRVLVDDGTNSQYIHGVDRTTAANAGLKSYVTTSTDKRDLTEEEMVRTCLQVRERSTKRITDILMGPGQIEKWLKIVLPDRQRAVSGGTYDKSLGIKNESELMLYAPGVAARVMLSFDIIPREIYYLSWDSWFHYVAKAMDWVDDDQLMHLGVGSSTYQAKWQAFMASFENIGCDMPGAQAVSRNLKDPILGD